MSFGLPCSAHSPRPSWVRTLAALKLATVMLLPEGTASAQARKDYAQTPTPKSIARRMLEIGGARPTDIVADLGSGDGRIPILAAQDFGARAIGVELDKGLHAAALANARRAGVTERVTLRQGDLFEASLSEVTLLTLYLPQTLTLRLRQRILSEMQPGTRVVSHEYGMGAWLPDRQELTDGHTILLWVVPARVGGRWQLQTGHEIIDLDIRQTFQEIDGTARIEGRSAPIEAASLGGTAIRFNIALPEAARRHFHGRVEGGRMVAVEEPGMASRWQAVRQ